VGPTLAVELRRLAGSAAPAAETIACRVDFGGLGADLAVDAAGARTALLADGGALFSVPVYEPSTALDLTRPTARAGTVASPVQGSLDDADFDRWTALGLALTSADLVGVMGGAIELACNYARGRRQYGTPIGSFQAVQHLLADAHTLMEGSRSTTLHAAWAVDALPPAQALAAAAAAKAYCSRAARTVCETTIQVHGGIGNTWDCMAHVFLRRALLSIDLLGGVGPNLERVLAAHGLATV
jgi:hypothetical protein